MDIKSIFYSDASPGCGQNKTDDNLQQHIEKNNNSSDKNSNNNNNSSINTTTNAGKTTPERINQQNIDIDKRYGNVKRAR